MRKILLLLSLALFLVIACGRTTTSFAQQQPMCTTTVNVSSAYGATSGSGSYVCGASVTFGVSPTTFTDGNVRHVFSGWSCSRAGCYSGSADTAQLTTGGDNSVIAETALWNTRVPSHDIIHSFGSRRTRIQSGASGRVQARQSP